MLSDNFPKDSEFRVKYAAFKIHLALPIIEWIQLLFNNVKSEVEELTKFYLLRAQFLMYLVLKLTPNLLFPDHDTNKNKFLVFTKLASRTAHIWKRKKLNLTLNFMSQTPETGNDSGWDPST